jgi:pentatricopeptide repeat protein
VLPPSGTQDLLSAHDGGIPVASRLEGYAFDGGGRKMEVLLTLLAREGACITSAETITWAEDRVTLYTSHYNRLIDAYAAAGDADGAAGALERISQRGLRPSSSSYAALLGYAATASAFSAVDAVR